MLTDRISDLLTRIRNAARARRSTVTIRSSKMLRSIADVLARNHYVQAVHDGDTKKDMVIMLLPTRTDIELKRISKPGQRIYVGYQEVKRVKSGLGIGILSTSHGLLTDAQVRKQKLGGEYLCQIW